MALPLFDVPRYKLELPSTGKVIEYRPFLVKEQKILLMAAGSGEEEQAQAVMDVIDACTFNKLNMKTLPSFDAEYIFLQLRARSVGEKVDLVVTCGNCGAVQNDQLDITEAKVNKDKNHSSLIDISDKLSVEMGYPSLADQEMDTTNPELTAALIAKNIRCIWQGDEKYDAADYSIDELNNFVDNLPPSGLDKLEHFFSTMPKLQHKISWTCAKCEAPNEIAMTGLKSFFV